MQSETERVPVAPEDVRDALLALSLIPAAVAVRYAGAVAKRSASFAAALIEVTPFKGAVRKLDDLWGRQLAQAERTAGESLEDVVAWLLTRLDINAIVAEQVDIEAIIQRVDVVALAQEVIYELNLPEIVRSSSQTMAAETVDGLRKHGMSADRAVSNFIDRLVGRKSRGAAPPGHQMGLEPT